MSHIEQMKRYIEKNPVEDPGLHYSLTIGEYGSLYEMAGTSAAEALALAFNYGKAKGFMLGKMATQKKRVG